ncbi:DUF11 domain-containing protein [Lacipirellula limnantheis]|uniref:Serine-aspartate repeat-containing protein D n=1 Tax=Lacipirellula limnantheis TaxID=2528024 RepID=A0A517TRZ6_9BACT|nr:SdrD B-like domain-containing protein [Lacipirellula limnantheis]QDT71152.1 Serine-aspartate repeat-containing protein D precursor [Lacipirellula limnantheis]
MAPLRFNPQSLFRMFQPARASQLTLAKGTRRRKGLGFESLESRQMMAADMAEIVGTVRLDVQNDDNAANDTLIAGATVQLYRDNGNGTFDVGDAVVGGIATTDALGQYRFTGLGAGKYFAKLTLPSAFQTKAGGGLQEINISAAESDGTIGQTIDDFESNQIAGAAPPLPSSDNSTKADTGVLGGERDLHVVLTEGSDIYSSVSLISGGGFLRLASGSMVKGNAKVVWDGQDGSATSLNPTGLGGLDFTSFNGNTMTGVVLKVGADHPNSVVKLKVYTNAGKWTEFTATVPETNGGAATAQLTFNFTGPASNSAGGGVDFSSVGAIELTFEGVTAVDGMVSLVGVIGLTTKTADFTAYEKINLGDRVWNDANNNSQLDNGEQGISGVKLNLYSDVDANNQFTPGVDTFVATTNTNGTGFYQFTDLLPGHYIVQVDSSNFNAGQALEGLKSSTGGAVDPDNGVDGDDNGVALAGYGVVSQALSLIAANNTVDFGFFGFDLVLDKSIEQTSASPLEELEYTVRIINDGPSTAQNVSFVDDLPAGVTYKSLTVDKAGINLTHSSGKITGSLGNMAAGEVILVKIRVDVKANATGTLLNKAEVSAPDEEYLLNNKDEVEIPIVPKIDLAVDKIDSKDPVKPGETFTYTVTVVNNGPSSATGVTVVDTMPATGVTYLTSSRAVSVNGRELTYDLGGLAAGASVTFTITVQVNQNFTGTLLNEVVVSANEEETTYANNHDAEPTVVKIDPASLDGYVYVDKDNDGIKDGGEKPIAAVILTLTGTDIFGASVTRTTVTDANGYYSFANLVPGTYHVNQTQPTKYKDGKDTVGNTFNLLGEMLINKNGFLGLDTVGNDNADADSIQQITLDSGYAAKDYNFGELAVTTSKVDFIRPIFYR